MCVGNPAYVHVFRCFFNAELCLLPPIVVSARKNVQTENTANSSKGKSFNTIADTCVKWAGINWYLPLLRYQTVFWYKKYTQVKVCVLCLHIYKINTILVKYFGFAKKKKNYIDICPNNCGMCGHFPLQIST